MNRFRLFPFFMLAILFVLASCGNPQHETPTFNNDAWVLNEGSWGGNNAALSALDCVGGTITQGHAFLTVNGRGLGDLAQDMIITDDNRLFITVSESNSIEVVNGMTGESIRRIDMGNRYPRYMCTDGQNLYVTCYTPRSVVRINLSSLEITGTCLLEGYKQPEQICYLGGKLYICSSWEIDEQGNFLYDNRLAVVNTSSFSLDTPIDIGCNPSHVKVLNDHSIVVSYAGNYGDQPAGTEIINVNTLIHTPLDVVLTNFDCLSGENGTIYGYCCTYDENRNTTYKFYEFWNNGTQMKEILPNANIQNAYGICVNPHEGGYLVYVCDAPYGGNGTISCYHAGSGELRWSTSAEVMPSKIVWINQPQLPE